MTNADQTGIAKDGLALAYRYQESGELADLQGAIELLRRAVDVPGPPTTWLINLCAALQQLHMRTGDLAVLSEAVDVGHRAVAASPGEPTPLSNLAAALEMLFQAGGDRQILDLAVQAARDAIDASAPDDHRRAGRLTNLCNSLRTLYLHEGDVDVLHEAVAVGRAAVQAPDDGTNPGVVQANFANALWELFEQTDDETVMLEATQAFQDAFAATPANDVNRQAMLASLALRRGAVALRNGDSGALAQSVEQARKALADTEPDHADTAHNRSLLATVLRGLFNLTGDVAALDESARLARAALDGTGENDPSLLLRLDNAAATLRMLYQRTGEQSVLKEAIQTADRAVENAPGGHVVRSAVLLGAATARTLLFERTGDEGLLREAVQRGRQAVEEQPTDGFQRGNLIAPLVALARHTGDTSLLDEAVALGHGIATSERTVTTTILSDAAHARLSRYQVSGDAADLNTAIAYCLSALKAIPLESHPTSGPALQTTMGDALLSLANTMPGQPREQMMLEHGRAALSDVTQSPAATTSQRIHAWRSLGRSALATNENDAALAAYTEAVQLLPTLASRRLVRGDREFGLGQVAGLAADAAAAAVAAARADRAVELLEQARVLLHSETIDTRSDLRVLRARQPRLYREFHRLRDALDAADHPVASSAQTVSPGRRAELARQLTALMTEIRTYPQLHGFLRPPRAQELCAQAERGPIVLVYTSNLRSDALVLTADRGVEVVALPELSPEAVLREADRFGQAQRAAIGSASYAERLRAHADLHAVLAWLWDVVAEPVLGHLGLQGPPDACWPRLWWCAVGTLSSLPLHAAGHHLDRDCPDKTVIDRVVSSYAYSVRSLSHARRESGARPSPALVVAMPQTPGQAPLASAAQEAQEVAALAGPTVVLLPPEATRAAVLDALLRHRIVHFACHAVGDPADPAAGRLLLHDHATSPLTVEALARLDLDGDLAFLSACDTSYMSARLADEAVHITAACHLAGYRNVIGTMAPVNATTVRISTAVYRYLTRDGAITLHVRDTALALHYAVRSIRAAHPRAPMLWLSSIHIGD